MEQDDLIKEKKRELVKYKRFLEYYKKIVKKTALEIEILESEKHIESLNCSQRKKHKK